VLDDEVASTSVTVADKINKQNVARPKKSVTHENAKKSYREKAVRKRIV